MNFKAVKFSAVLFVFFLASTFIFISDWALRFSSLFLGVGLLIYAFSTKKPIAIVYSIFISSYFLYLVPYFFYDIPFATRSDYQAYEVSSLNMYCLIMFVTSFFLMLEYSDDQYFSLNKKIYRAKNLPIFLFCIFIVLFFTILMISGAENAFNSDYRFVTEIRYGFIDYAIIFIFFSYYFSNKKYDNLIILVAFVYMLICIIYGYRLRMTQMGLLVFFLFFEDKVKPWLLALLTVMLFWGLKIVGILRGIDKNVSVDSILGLKNGVIVSNQGGVFLNANMYIGLVEDGLISGSERITTFLGNFLAIFYSQSALPDKYNVSRLAENYFSIPGGGLISGYIYLWGGLLLAIPVGLLIGYLYSRLLRDAKSSIYFLAYMIVIVATFPRWFAYDPIHFFKMGFYSVVVLASFIFLDKLMRKA